MQLVKDKDIQINSAVNDLPISLTCLVMSNSSIMKLVSRMSGFRARMRSRSSSRS